MLSREKKRDKPIRKDEKGLQLGREEKERRERAERDLSSGQLLDRSAKSEKSKSASTEDQEATGTNSTRDNPETPREA